MNVLLTCEACGKQFERSSSEANRNKKKGRRIFCSLRCQGKIDVKNFDGKVVWEHLRHINRLDEFSPFRNHLKSVRSHCKGRERTWNITLQDLKEQWEKQKGICPYTGWEMKNLKKAGQKLPCSPDRASLDRIDSSKGYTKDNIQFLSLIAQYAKNSWDGKVIYDFCESVIKHKSGA